MTLDEAIQRENKISEENQKIVDTQIVFDDVSISELYCDDTEIIEEHLSNYKKCAEYHKQIVEWLEELKMYKSLAPRELVSEKQKNDRVIEYSKGFNYGFNTGYNKAVDDFVKEICKMIVQSENNGNYRFYAVEIKQAIADLAEQLKAGATND